MRSEISDGNNILSLLINVSDVQMWDHERPWHSEDLKSSPRKSYHSQRQDNII